jgi:hypothetical protein
MHRFFEAGLHMLLQGSAGFHMPAGDINVHFCLLFFLGTYRLLGDERWSKEAVLAHIISETANP